MQRNKNAIKRMFLLFSHILTPLQIKDAKKSLKIEKFIYLPKELQKIWSSIPPDIEDIKDLLEPIKEFLEQNSKKDDFVLIQGDFGATCYMVSFTKKIGLIPIYSTNKRVAKEIKEGDKLIKISEFEHTRYRKFVL